MRARECALSGHDGLSAGLGKAGCAPSAGGDPERRVPPGMDGIETSDAVLTVGALTERLRRTLEARFPFVWVRGEVSNLTRPASGHIYFSLKDEDAQLHCVWFRGQQHQARSFDPLTGEVFDAPRPAPADLLRNGLEMLCAGRVGVYAARGQYQLVVELAQPAGEGLLAQAFEERKRRLALAGYFTQERKRPLPRNPQRVALITSPTGAAVHDFLELADARGCSAHIRLFPVSVQGEHAVADIVAAIETANAQDWAEVIVLVRGGGSLEDLWTFNETPVADAIFHSRLPVLAGIGHEVDISLADLTADRRAATPSHAAQLLWPLRAELRQRLDDLDAALTRAILSRIERLRTRLSALQTKLAFSSPVRALERRQAQAAALEAGLTATARRWLERIQATLENLEQRRRSALTPAALAARTLRVELLTAQLPRLATQRLADSRARLAANGHRLQAAMAARLDRDAALLDRLETALEGANPLLPLRRGYALLYHPNGRLARSVSEFAAGDSLVARMADGRIAALVKRCAPDSSVRPPDAAQTADKAGDQTSEDDTP